MRDAESNRSRPDVSVPGRDGRRRATKMMMRHRSMSHTTCPSQVEAWASRRGRCRGTLPGRIGQAADPRPLTSHPARVPSNHVLALDRSVRCHQILVGPANDGYEPDKVRRRLEELEDRGHAYEILDSDALSTEARLRFYDDASAVAVRWHVRISSVFGSARKSGHSGFGTSGPALLVYDETGETLNEVYPHGAKVAR